MLIEEHSIVSLYSSNTKYTLPFHLLTLSIVGAELLLSLHIAIAQNLFPLSPWLLIIAVHSVLGRFCGAFIPDGHRNETAENAVMQTTLHLCMMCDTRYFLLLQWITKHTTAPVLKILAN